jgi:hypothetical protein
MSAETFRSTAPTLARPQSFRFFSVGTIKTLSLFSSNWKWTDNSPTHFSCSSNIRNRPGTFQRVQCPWLEVSMRAFIQVEDFRVFVVNCDLINNKNLIVIKFATCISNVLYQLYVEYYVPFIVKRNLSNIFKNYPFPHICLYVFSFVFLWRTHSWRLSIHFKSILYIIFTSISQRKTKYWKLNFKAILLYVAHKYMCKNKLYRKYKILKFQATSRIFHVAFRQFW